MILALAFGFGLGVLLTVLAMQRDGYERPHVDRDDWSTVGMDGVPYAFPDSERIDSTVRRTLTVAPFFRCGRPRYRVVVDAQDSTLP